MKKVLDAAFLAVTGTLTVAFCIYALPFLLMLSVPALVFLGIYFAVREYNRHDEDTPSED